MAKLGSLRKCMRVKTSGKGRTARWPSHEGTVLRVHGTAVFVRWDGTSFSDEMTFGEIVRIPGKGC